MPVPVRLRHRAPETCAGRFGPPRSARGVWWTLLVLAIGFWPRTARAEPREIVVPADRAWTDTGIDLAGSDRAIRIDATGRATILHLKLREYLFGLDFDRAVGPEGTYVWPRHYWRRGNLTPATTHFPVPAGVDGPAPAFGLIAKIGEDGPAFYAGAHYQGVPDRAGRLWLGINDYNLRDNHGAFHARVTFDPPPRPEPVPTSEIRADGTARPQPHARVLLLYVDGLRPDVLHEMAEAGFLPNLKAAFLDQGLECANAFTTFPSNTLVANGALFTGLFPDRTGIKSQNQFERTTLKHRGHMSEWMPDWLFSRTTKGPQVSDLLDKFAPENTYRFLRQRGILTLGNAVGTPNYRFTILPITPMNPPTQWLHRALNTIRNPFKASLSIPDQLDVINGRYVIEEMLGDPDARVMAAWFPMVDKVSHHSARGQYGAARRELVVFDRFFGRMMKRLGQVGWGDSTYLILVSDHGHVGGEREVSHRCNLARELFFRRLGCNVSVVGQDWTVTGSDPKRFVFLDHQAWGTAAIYLPKGSYTHGPWQRNSLAELMDYDLGPNRGRANLLETITQFQGPEWQPGLSRPVDVALVKLDASRVLVYRSAENQALITVGTRIDGAVEYRYEPIRGVRAGSDGQIGFDPPRHGEDPLGWLRDRAFAKAVQPLQSAEWCATPHTAQEWLQATAETDYPDAVVGMAKFFAWRPPMEDLADARDPDLLVTAARGWSFRSEDDFGTDHGAPLREAMRITLFLSGRGIRHGVLREPHRIIDVMPTMLDLAGVTYRAEQLDGRAITGIYEE